MKNLLLLLILFSSLNLSCQVIKIKHTYYEITFDCKLKEPLYTHYTLTKNMCNSKFDRTNFHSDDNVSLEVQANENDYHQDPKKMIYDKGHLSPDIDFTFNKKAESEVMVFTNCAPQDLHFNRGIWRKLEDHVRELCKKTNIEVYTGCIYDGSIEKLNSLIVPKFYWKLIKLNNNFYGWLIPNKTDNGKDFEKFKVDPNILLKLIN